VRVLAAALHPAGGDRMSTLVELAPERAQTLVDPRVAKHGGTRRRSKSNYDFPGMMDDGNWRKTLVHKHTSVYACAWCGQGFTGPHAVYTHLAKIHDR
jgi:hypothetical protein